MNNEFNNSRNANNNKFNDFDYEMANKRFSPYNQPKRLINNNNFRSQEISKINYDVPKSPINYEAKEMSLSDYIKNLCEFENVEALFECVKMLKSEKTLEEIQSLDDETMLKYFMDAEKKILKK